MAFTSTKVRSTRDVDVKLWILYVVKSQDTCTSPFVAISSYQNCSCEFLIASSSCTWGINRPDGVTFTVVKKAGKQEWRGWAEQSPLHPTLFLLHCWSDSKSFSWQNRGSFCSAYSARARIDYMDPGLFDFVLYSSIFLQRPHVSVLLVHCQ